MTSTINAEVTAKNKPVCTSSQGEIIKSVWRTQEDQSRIQILASMFIKEVSVVFFGHLAIVLVEPSPMIVSSWYCPEKKRSMCDILLVSSSKTPGSLTNPRQERGARYVFLFDFSYNHSFIRIWNPAGSIRKAADPSRNPSRVPSHRRPQVRPSLASPPPEARPKMSPSLSSKGSESGAARVLGSGASGTLTL